MRRHNDRRPVAGQRFEQIENAPRGPAVQLAGGFIGQQQRRSIRQGTGDCDPLPLTTRQLSRAVPQPIAEADPVQQLVRPLTPLSASGTAVASTPKLAA